MLTVMNATVSHEIRNPLNALIAQIAFIKNLLFSLAAILQMLKVILKDEELYSKLMDIY